MPRIHSHAHAGRPPHRAALPHRQTAPDDRPRRAARSRLVAAVLAVGCAVGLTAGCVADQQPSDTTGTMPSVWTGSTVPSTIGDAPGDPGHSPGGNTITAGFIDAEGRPAGTVTFVERPGLVEIRAEVHGMEPGFHGFHIHERGECEMSSTPPGGGERGAFLSAGGHMQVGGHTGQPASGDLTSIHVRRDGRGLLVTTTSAFTLADLIAEGAGRAAIIHADADNFGNIPTRYALPDGGEVPDKETLSTGDAGPRAACAAIS
ncbi:superoxide dismutase family protein [Nocardia otitidiscaviarum]|uniref:superoxide dismutase[Cu-Zn] n=1 Tax=Nocardia otitidiscaviarum TaxID=1823 RepID=UPI0009DD4EE8|nr:superoxide dismutase family protein [Nocardia otitidiscaviarum]MBF6133299.1 superoxide dismutase family protein [Nocardia otitidiscaviarum]MBF6486695.1 superoxide dismutase family protein [Nocardia otitidiscaviarum]